MEIINFSGLPILIIHNTYDISKNEINFIKNLEYVENEHENCKGLNFSKNKYILQVKKLKKLKETFDLKLNHYTKNVLQINNNFLLKNSWTTLQFGKTTHPAHVHPNVLLSIVYYVECDNGNILFTRDRSLLAEGFHFDYDIIEHNQ